MKKQESEVRDKFLKIRVNDSEISQLKKLQKKSIERSLSNYVRRVILQKPVTVNFRNQSVDELSFKIIRLKNELNAVANNFNQAVHKLHTLEIVPEFRTWIMLYEYSKQQVEEKVKEISSQMYNIYKLLEEEIAAKKSEKNPQR